MNQEFKSEDEFRDFLAEMEIASHAPRRADRRNPAQAPQAASRRPLQGSQNRSAHGTCPRASFGQQLARFSLRKEQGTVY